jgi:hypothetical protein
LEDVLNLSVVNVASRQQRLRARAVHAKNGEGPNVSDRRSLVSVNADQRKGNCATAKRL